MSLLILLTYTSPPAMVCQRLIALLPFFLDIRLQQFLQFEHRSRIVYKKGGVFKTLSAEEDYFSQALYTIDIGQNDLIAGYFANRTADEYFLDVMNRFSTMVKSLYQKGGRYFWVHNAGPIGYGVGSRIKLPYTRKIIDAIHSGSLLTANYTKTEVFGMEIPTHVEDFDSDEEEFQLAQAANGKASLAELGKAKVAKADGSSDKLKTKAKAVQALKDDKPKVDSDEDDDDDDDDEDDDSDEGEDSDEDSDGLEIDDEDDSDGEEDDSEEEEETPQKVEVGKKRAAASAEEDKRASKKPHTIAASGHLNGTC